MRVTENANYEQVRKSIQDSRRKIADLQTKSATLSRLNSPSDDPVAAAKVLELRTDRVNNDQFQMNAHLVETFLNNTDHALADLEELVIRAKELAINQSSGASSSEETRLSVAEEVEQLLLQAISIGNRKVGERFLFGGFKTQTPPVSNDGQYLGDDGKIMVEVANDVFLTMNIPGAEVFNTEGEQLRRYNPAAPEGEQEVGPYPKVNVNLFDTLQNFRISLLAGDRDGIHNSLDRFDEVLSKLLSTRAKIGSRVQGLQYTGQAIERHNVTNSMLTSTLEDADMAKVISELGKEEAVFKSSLESAKRLIQPSLLDFLR